MRKVARYTVLSGMPGYMPNFTGGAYVFHTRKELAEWIREEIRTLGYPANLFRQVHIRRLWRFIQRHGSSSAHVSLYHGSEVLEFIGLTEEEYTRREQEEENG